MDRSRNTEALKQRALAALDEARLELVTDLRRAQVDYHPRTLVTQSIRKHRAWWMVAAAAGGFVTVRWLFRPRVCIEKEKKFSTPGTVGRTLRGLLLTSLWPLARGPVVDFAQKQLHTFLSGRVSPPISEQTPSDQS